MRKILRSSHTLKKKQLLLSVLFWICNFAAYAQLPPVFSDSFKAIENDGIKSIQLAEVFSGLSVGFDIYTTKKYQYVAYYDTDRNMTIAQRALNSNSWNKTKLPVKVGWDSHNSIVITTDKSGYIHLSGNMHVNPLLYFRSKKPENIAAFDQLFMTGNNEDKVTYPLFFKDNMDNLYYQYRNGSSGKGITYWNKYDELKKSWVSAFDTPLFDGEKEASAYMSNPILGPDGYFHIIYMWRQTIIANTNHNISYLRSKDLKHWENIKGRQVDLPVKWSNNATVVDPVGPWNGLINIGFNISWDKDKKIYVTYHKFDHNGISQVYIATFNNNFWEIHQISNWADFSWDLNRGGSIGSEVGISKVTQVDANSLSVHYNHKKYGSGIWILDKSSLKIKDRLKIKPPKYMAEIAAAEAPVKNMIRHHKMDNTGKFVLHWQTLGPNQDVPRLPPYSAPTMLTIFKLN